MASTSITILCDLESFSTLYYIDDVVIFSDTWETNLVHLRTVLIRLKENNLTVKSEKCMWGCTTFEHLGFVVGNGRLSIPECHVEEFKNFTRPTTQSQFRSFLGILNYYRKFIHLSDLYSSLTCMTKPSQPKKLCWTTETDHAFHSVISSICAFTVLVVPCDNDAFAVLCDASTHGVRGALCVCREDVWMPAAFCSRQLQPQETK